MTPRTERVMDRAKEYGWSQVAAAKLYATFDEIVSQAEPTFTPLKNGQLVRQSSESIVQMFQIGACKGGQYAFRWGLSLAFVPHEWSPRPKFHRTLKTARF